MSRNGFTLRAIPAGIQKAQATSTLNELQAFGLTEPLQADKATKASMKIDPKLREAAELHSEVQRIFDKGRILRSMNYAEYIRAVEFNGQPGGTPAITLWHPDALECTSEGIVIPYNTAMTALDGETQLQARFFLRDGCELYGDVVEGDVSTGEQEIAVTIYHSISMPHARQILHDYNTYATPIPETKAATFNSAGPLSEAVQQALVSAGVDLDEVNRRSPRPGKNHVCSYNQMLYFCAGSILNGSGLKGNVTAGRLKEMNKPTSSNRPPQKAIDELKHSVMLARNNDDIRLSHVQVWQVAGALVSKGHKNLNWNGGVAAYENTKISGRGGVRMKPADRLAEIASGFGA